MPTGTSERKTYLHITYGKLRQRANEGDPEAVSRENKDGKVVWERVYSWVEGRITGIYYKEDEKYGNSFEVTVDDGKEKFQVSFSENDSYFSDFFCKLPNADLTKWVKIAPYAFEDKNSNKMRKGIVLMQDDAKVENYFQAKENDKWVYKNGFPAPKEPANKMNKDKWKIYFLEVGIFLKDFIKEQIIPKVKNQDFNTMNASITEVNETNEVPPVDDDNPDLPF